MPIKQLRVFGCAILCAAASYGSGVTYTETGSVATEDLGRVAESLAWAAQPKERPAPAESGKKLANPIGFKNSITEIILNGAGNGGSGSEASNCPIGTPEGTICGTIFDSNEQTPDTLPGRDWQIQGGNSQFGYSMAVTYSNEFAMTFTSACKTGRSPVGGRPALSPCDDAWAQLAFYFSSGAIAFTHGPALGFAPEANAMLATPEPASLLLFGTGLLALVLYGCARKKKPAL
jgi:hypothetical protein